VAIDTVHLRMSRERTSEREIERLLSKLKGQNNTFNEFGDYVRSSGNMENMRVLIGPTQMKIQGSLGKYLLGNNLEEMTSTQTRLAIEKLQDETRMNLTQAQLTRIDVGANIQTKFNPKLYYPYLGQSRYYQRNVFKGTLYYDTETEVRQIAIYDKVREAKKSAMKQGLVLPPHLLANPVMRIEVRFKKRLQKRFNRSEIQLQTLANPGFYQDLHERFKNEYETIQKVNNMIGLPEQLPSTPKEGMNLFAMYGLGQLGLEKALHLVAVWKAQGAFKRKEEYSRLKAMIKDLYTSPKRTTESELITELNTKVLSAIENSK
jgi:hypothetical protein